MLTVDGERVALDGAQGEKPAEARDFASLEEYIFGSTARIWEGRGLDLIRRWYAPDSIVRTPMGVTHGIEPVVAATRQTLHEFPDRRLLGEDVVWCAQGPGGASANADPAAGEGTPGGGRTGRDDAQGAPRTLTPGEEGAAWPTAAPHYSSHRIVSPMRHAGSGSFGAATGRPVRARTIADCVVVDERISEEWLVRDHGAIVAALGRDVAEQAREDVRALREAGREPPTLTPANDPPGPYRSPLCTDERALRFAETLQTLWRDDLAAVGRDYDEAVALELYNGVSGAGHDMATRHWLSLGASMPGARFSVDHVIGRADPGRPHRVALRWTARGKHDGHGLFGAPTGADLFVLGITHAEFARGRVHREWTLVDTLAVHRQIAAHVG